MTKALPLPSITIIDDCGDRLIVAATPWAPDNICLQAFMRAESNDKDENRTLISLTPEGSKQLLAFLQEHVTW